MMFHREQTEIGVFVLVMERFRQKICAKEFAMQMQHAALRTTPTDPNSHTCKSKQEPRDDALLLSAIAKGDADAFQTLYQRHKQRILGFLIGIVHNRAVAEDLMNEVFLASWRSADRFEGRAQPLTWLMSIARNQAISALRKQREVTGVIDDVTYNLADEADQPDASAEKSNDADVIRRCINMLSPAHRAIVDLVYYQECTVTEAAAILSVPKNTVKTRMFYARKKLSGLLEAHGLVAA